MGVNASAATAFFHAVAPLIALTPICWIQALNSSAVEYHNIYTNNNNTAIPIETNVIPKYLYIHIRISVGTQALRIQAAPIEEVFNQESGLPGRRPATATAAAPIETTV